MTPEVLYLVARLPVVWVAVWSRHAWRLYRVKGGCDCRENFQQSFFFMHALSPNSYSPSLSLTIRLYSSCLDLNFSPHTDVAYMHHTRNKIKIYSLNISKWLFGIIFLIFNSLHISINNVDLLNLQIWQDSFHDNTQSWSPTCAQAEKRKNCLWVTKRGGERGVSRQRRVGGRKKKLTVCLKQKRQVNTCLEWGHGSEHTPLLPCSPGPGIIFPT